MATYLEIVGGPAYGDAELQKIKTLAEAEDLSIRQVYYVHLPAAAAQQSTRDELAKVLEESEEVSAEEGFELLYVTPRNTTPWSSNATTIMEVSHLPVSRVEKGRIVKIKAKNLDASLDHLYDRMTETITTTKPNLAELFRVPAPGPLGIIDIFGQQGKTPSEALQEYSVAEGLQLRPNQIEYLVKQYESIGRPPHDVELFMFAQVNSEHCRHNIFNAKWTIDGIPKEWSPFGLIRQTHKKHPRYTVSAYSDNAAVLDGVPATFWAPNYSTGSWTPTKEQVNSLIKVETHNHPTAISPFPGAATGSGGEIRDEGAVGRGSTPKAGLCGFWVSDLNIPGHQQPWEKDVGKPAHFASPLFIMLEAPIGSARFNNEFGRPCLTGSFKTLLTTVGSGNGETEIRGYHKPIMIAGGHGTVRPQHALKRKEDVKDGAHVIVLGGPAMLIGLGGGAASSNATLDSSVELDFNSVQRGNPEMQRKAQQVIDACTALGDENPIVMIHDVGAGGLSNALPELVKEGDLGGHFELRQIDNADPSMSPLQIWCCEAQERYVLLVNEPELNRFTRIANRERSSFRIVGRATGKSDKDLLRLVLTDRDSPENPRPIDLPMATVFPENSKIDLSVTSRPLELEAFDAFAAVKDASDSPKINQAHLEKAIERVFNLPGVGSKSFLITIGDRTVKGLTVRDQMVGPWQTPVADVAVTAAALQSGIKTGEAMSMGDKATLALISPAASARMAVAESLMNLGAADILGGLLPGSEVPSTLARVRLSANWMADINHPGEAANLYAAVEAIASEEFCQELGISIPVGKDSMSMRAAWKDPETKEAKKVVAPMTVVISAFAPVANIKGTWTPTLQQDEDVGETVLIYVDLAKGHQALGGSALAQAFGQLGNEGPDVRDVELLKDYYDALGQLHESGIVLAYHDISDGGLITTIAEMMFAGRCGAEVMLDSIVQKRNGAPAIMDALFNEELGAVFQVRKSDETNFRRCFATCGPPKGMINKIGRVPPTNKQVLSISYHVENILSIPRAKLQQWWSSTSYQMQRLRDNPACADAEYESISDDNDPGLSYKLSFNPNVPLKESLTSSLLSPFRNAPRVAILREQGVNGHAEMAFAFRCAGFDPIDVHMKDILDGHSLSTFVGLAACGGFSYGDTLGAGVGWAMSILRNETARKEFKQFFERPDTFALGVCNGCQMLTRVAELIPGTQGWPLFKSNASAQFEARSCMVSISEPKTRYNNSTAASTAKESVFLHGMSGSAFPIAVSHGEGRAVFKQADDLRYLNENGMVPMRYVDNYGKVTERYPANPNGSPEGVAGVKSLDGRVLAMMPHPERTVLADVGSYVPKRLREEWGEEGPWARLFRSARRWVAS